MSLTAFTGTQALADSGLKYSDIQQAVVGYVYGKAHYLYLENL